MHVSPPTLAPAAMTRPLSRREFQRLLTDPDSTEDDLRPYVEVDEERSEAFNPSIKLRDGVLEDEGLEGDVLVGALNGYSRWRRARRYWHKIRRGFDGIRLVSEGDSWFQYPVLLDDVIDVLCEQEDLAIRSLGAAGDLLSVMLREDELSEAIEKEQPHGLLLSGGGNDMVGGGRLTTMVHPFDDERAPEDYPNGLFDRFLDEIEELYRGLFRRLGSQHPGLKIFVHGYDYAIPDKGRWLGTPLQNAGIAGRGLQRKIIRVMIDRLNRSLKRLGQEFEGYVIHVDCRRAVENGDWYDELHPRNVGYESVAERFLKAIRRELGGTQISRENVFGFGAAPSVQEVQKPDLSAIERAASDRFSATHRSIGSAFSELEGVVPLHVDSNDRTEVRRRLLPEPDQLALERILGRNNLFHVNYFEQGMRAARAVCRINVRDELGVPVWNGTGFLVGEGLLLTNNHVLPDRRLGGTAEFDYEYDVDYRQRDSVEFRLLPEDVFVTNKALDYTFIGVELTSDGGRELLEFGALPLVPDSGKALIGEPVSIIQHPSGSQKRVALRDSNVLGIPDPPGDDFIHYSTDTEPGSSGSCVLNDQFQVVALHHAGVRGEGGTWVANEGTRVSRIFDSLRRESGGGSAEERRTALKRLGAALSPSRDPRSMSVAVASPRDRGSRVPHHATDPVLREFTGRGYDPDFLEAHVPMPRPRLSGCEGPESGGGSRRLDYTHFSVTMNLKRRLAWVAAVNIDGAQLRRIRRGRDHWRIDERIPADAQMDNTVYRHNELDRGHLVRRLSPAWGSEREARRAVEDTFYYTNAAPQHEDLNQKTWLDLEDYLLKRARDRRLKVSVFTGPVFRSDDRLYRGEYRIPSEYWKIVAWVDRDGGLRASGYMQTQRDMLDDIRERAFGDYKTYRVPIARIAREARLDLDALADLGEHERFGASDEARVIDGWDGASGLL